MKNIFPGYSRKSEEDIKKMWEKSTLIFDANVLLNLYRYSDSTRDTILDLIEKFSDRIWLPHQSALEYNRNRYEVIADQEKAYKEFIEKIEQIKKDLQSTNKPPFLSNTVHEDLNNVFTKVVVEVDESIKKYCEYLKSDPIYDNIDRLFDGKISQCYSEEKLEELYKEGETRYKSKFPPGYEDEKNKEGNRKFGDLVLWKQIIDKGKESKNPIIFITDERKIDWWWKIKDGRNMGPRQELVEEMKREANIDFHMYSSERFLSYGQSYLEEKVNQKALEEIQALKRTEIEELRKRQMMAERELEIRKRKFEEEAIYINHKIMDINKQIHEINRKQEELRIHHSDDMDVQEYSHNLSIHVSELQFQKAELEKRRMMLEMESRESVEQLDKEQQMMYKRIYRKNRE